MATTKFEKPVGSETFQLQQQVSTMNTSLNALTTKVGNVGSTDLQTQVNTLNSNLGNIISDNTGTTTVPSGTRTKIAEKTISAGVYVIVRGIDWAPNATGKRTINKENGASRHHYVTQMAVSGEDTIMQMVTTEAFGSTTTIEIWGFQDSGANLVAYPYWYIVRLK